MDERFPNGSQYFNIMLLKNKQRSMSPKNLPRSLSPKMNKPKRRVYFQVGSQIYVQKLGFFFIILNIRLLSDVRN